MLVIILSSASFMLVSFSAVQWQAFLGVVFAALSGGLGEVTFLQYSAGYHRYNHYCNFLMSNISF